MMTSSTLLLASLLTTFALTGCAPANEEASSSATAEMTAAPQRASLRAVPVRITRDKCVVAVDTVSVTAGDPAVAARINATLAVEEDTWLAGRDCTTEHAYRGAYSVSYNDHGLLSIELVRSYFDGATGHTDQVFEAKTYDLRTGDALELLDLLDDEGVKALVNACESTLRSQGLDEASCAAAVAPKQTTPLVVERDGIRLFLVNVPGVAFPVASAGTLAPWSWLRGHVTNPLVATIAP